MVGKGNFVKTFKWRESFMISSETTNPKFSRDFTEFSGSIESSPIPYVLLARAARDITFLLFLFTLTVEP